MDQKFIKFGINDFSNDIKFSKEYYPLYKNIFVENISLTDEIFIHFILQISLQTKFNGYFDELYTDVIKRKPEYMRELINNFKVSLIGKQKIYNKFYKMFCLYGKISDKEIYFHRKISLFDFDSIFNDYFDLNDNNKKIYFILTCQKIYDYKMNEKYKSNPNEKKVKFGSNKIHVI
jgi:hypothetical protein